MEIAQVIERIVQGRNKKGYTYENMAVELDLTTAAYRKIETGETKLTLERLFKISDILEVPVGELLAACRTPALSPIQYGTPSRGGKSAASPRRTPQVGCNGTAKIGRASCRERV